MLTKVEVGQFKAFGYVILRGCLRPDEVRALQEAFDRGIESAPDFDAFGTGGSKRLTPFVEADDSFAAVIEHPGIMEGMRDIDGAEFLYHNASDLTANVDDVFWHCDGVPTRQISTAKTAIYLDDLSDGDGALSIIPGSHHPEFSAALLRSYGPLRKEYRRSAHEERPRANIPGVVSVQTRPGDVLLWDNRLWHSARRRSNGTPRRNMFIEYVRDPKDDPVSIFAVREYIAAGLASQAARSGPKHRPFIYSKELMRKGGPAREKMAARLEELGVDNVRE